MPSGSIGRPGPTTGCCSISMVTGWRTHEDWVSAAFSRRTAHMSLPSPRRVSSALDVRRATHERPPAREGLGLMTDKDNWRWDDLDSVFDDDFVEKAEFKEDDWKARKEAQLQRKKDAAKDAKRKARATRVARPPGVPDAPAREPLTREGKIKRAAIVAGILALL